jgi:hypothetical protein
VNAKMAEQTPIKSTSAWLGLLCLCRVCVCIFYASIYSNAPLVEYIKRASSITQFNSSHISRVIK